MQVKIQQAIITLLTLAVAPCVSASANESQSQKVTCGQTKIEIVTQFAADSCYERMTQTITFQGGPTPVVLDSVGNEADASFVGRPIPLRDGWATRYLCVKPESMNPFFILNFSNGGNCEECEWSAIYDSLGAKKAGGRSVSEKISFEKACRALGLKGSWHSQGFVEIRSQKCE